MLKDLHLLLWPNWSSQSCSMYYDWNKRAGLSWSFISLLNEAPGCLHSCKNCLCRFCLINASRALFSVSARLGPLAIRRHRQVQILPDVGWPGEGKGTKKGKGGKMEGRETALDLFSGNIASFPGGGLREALPRIEVGWTPPPSSTFRTHFLLKHHVHFLIYESVSHVIYNKPQFWRCRKF